MVTLEACQLEVKYTHTLHEHNTHKDVTASKVLCPMSPPTLNAQASTSKTTTTTTTTVAHRGTLRGRRLQRSRSARCACHMRRDKDESTTTRPSATLYPLRRITRPTTQTTQTRTHTHNTTATARAPTHTHTHTTHAQLHSQSHTMSKLNFRSRQVDYSKPLPVYFSNELPDLQVSVFFHFYKQIHTHTDANTNKNNKNTIQHAVVRKKNELPLTTTTKTTKKFELKNQNNKKQKVIQNKLFFVI